MELTVDNILDEQIETEAIGNVTVREYFSHLMFLLWTHGEGFDGKRPLGNSSWQMIDVCYSIAEKYGLDEDGNAADDIFVLIQEALAKESGVGR